MLGYWWWTSISSRARGWAPPTPPAGGRLGADSLLGGGGDQVDVLLEQVVVEVADDHRHRRALGVAADLVGVDVALAAVGGLRRQVVGRQRRDDLRGQPRGVDEDVLREAWVDVDAVDGQGHLGGG